MSLLNFLKKTALKPLPRFPVRAKHEEVEDTRRFEIRNKLSLSFEELQKLYMECVKEGRLDLAREVKEEAMKIPVEERRKVLLRKERVERPSKRQEPTIKAVLYGKAWRWPLPEEIKKRYKNREIVKVICFWYPRARIVDEETGKVLEAGYGDMVR